MAAKPITVSLSGCGAAAALYHAPVLDALEAEGVVRLAALFDPDRRGLAGIGGRFPRARQVGRFEELLAEPPDLVIIASPPSFHAEQAASALQAGSAVFCEKPVATRLADAQTLVALARRSGRILAAGMVRRHFPAARVIRAALQSGAIGLVRRIRCFEGGPFHWPVQSPSYFTRAGSGGGVLMDIGVHALDLLGWWFGPCAVLSYEDDAMGGVEAECRMRLEFGEVEGELRLSRLWSRPNRYEIIGTSGTLVWMVNEADHLEARIGDMTYGLDATIRHESRPASNFHQCLLDQLRAVCAAVTGESAEFVSAADTLPALELIERCYDMRKLIPMDWLEAEERRTAEELAGTGC